MSQFLYSDFIHSIENFDAQYALNITEDSYFGYPLQPILHIEEQLRSAQVNNVAYFSMEYGLAPSIYNTFSSHNKLPEHNQLNSYEVFSNQWDRDHQYYIEDSKMLDLPIYSGGLGVLAGDTIKSAADLGYTFCGIGMLWNKGYFQQKLWHDQGQTCERSAMGSTYISRIDSIENTHHHAVTRGFYYGTVMEILCI